MGWRAHAERWGVRIINWHQVVDTGRMSRCFALLQPSPSRRMASRAAGVRASDCAPASREIDGRDVEP
jgi:hypothetical protein